MFSFPPSARDVLYGLVFILITYSLDVIANDFSVI